MTNKGEVMFAEVIINSHVKKLNKVFDYQIPEALCQTIRVGSKVLVPFGNAKKGKEGFVYAIKENSVVATKPILEVLDNTLTSDQMELAKRMSQMYFCNIYDGLKLMLPPGSECPKEENRIKDKLGRFIYLKQEIDEIENALEDGCIKSPKQRRVIEFLRDNDGIYVGDLKMLTESSDAILKTLEKNGYIESVEQKIERNPFEHKEVPRDTKLPLNSEQQKAFGAVKEAMDQEIYKSFLLFGVTGSGKTEVYLQLIEETLKKGKKAIVLVPEISLTPQMVDRFLARFGNCIAVLHSKLSMGERYDEWNKIKENRANIVIGARSAIFAPVENLGIVIMDEEHDSSYKSDMTPRYQAKDIARYWCKKNKIPFVMGSATPDICTFYQCKQGKIEVLTLSQRANQSHLPDVSIVDLREELAKGNKSMLSEALHQAIEDNLKEKRQTILFLNRRGYSTFVMCRECGFTAKCKYCNITLTYHAVENKLKCHYCGYQIPNYTVCPVCGSRKIKYFGAGTQKLEEEIHHLFPEATTIRMDVDTVTKKNSHEEILKTFQEDKIDILIGTQMVVKGHHFPNVTLVGVVAADGSLNTNDYRAGERTFQILTQVAGRAGREKLPGHVIIQTYNRDHYSIQYAKEQNYLPFFEAEIGMRKQLKYPPFCDIILFSFVSKNEKEVQKTAKQFYQKIKKACYAIPDFAVMQPVPSPISKMKNRYRWRIIAKGKMNQTLLKIFHALLNQYNQSNQKTRIILDINPNNMN